MFAALEFVQKAKQGLRIVSAGSRFADGVCCGERRQPEICLQNRRSRFATVGASLHLMRLQLERGDIRQGGLHNGTARSCPKVTFGRSASWVSHNREHDTSCGKAMRLMPSTQFAPHACSCAVRVAHITLLY